MADDRADRTLYVGNLENDVTEDILYELFSQAGPLVSVKRIADKPFAFVEFKHDVSVPYAKDIMSGTHLFKKELRLQFRSGSIHQQQSQRPSQSQNYQRANSYPNPQGQFSSQYQQNMNSSQFQDPRQAMFLQQQMQGNFHSKNYGNGQQQGQFQNPNNDFRRSPQYHRAQSFNEQDSRGNSGYDGGRSRQYDRGQDDRQRNSGGNQHGHHMQNEPQEIIQKQMRRSAETEMRHSPGNRGQYQHHNSRSGGHHHRR